MEWLAEEDNKMRTQAGRIWKIVTELQAWELDDLEFYLQCVLENRGRR
jgi:hypothetical protein